jgi:LysR family transcriptional regulator, glycine cleavage system transcriptional activator
MRRLPPLNALRAFEAAARLGSLTRAAAELGVTHGAVSRHIRAMEDYLGAPLFNRSGRGLLPTDRARDYLSEVSAGFDRLALATERMIEPATARILHVNALPTLTMRWLIPRLPAFYLNNPNIEVRLTTSVEPVERLGDPYDIVIRRAAMRRPGFACRPFLAEESLPVCTPKFLKRHPIKSPRDLLGLTLLHTDGRPSAWSDWFALAGVAPKRQPKGLRFEHHYFTIQAALNDLGLSLAPRPLIADDLEAGRLVAPLSGPVLRTTGYHVLYPADRPRGARSSRFVDWLVEQGKSASPSAAS